ncbi:MAG: D-ribose pyranase [Calditrichales bacterium]|nr:MAG: D-ribose pyranase [Calditrichales bacterium]
MKKYGILNAALSEIIASMGHSDKLVICDAGLPIPKGAKKVDLALVKNIPGFIETLTHVLKELEIEQAVIADEMQQVSLPIYEKVCELIPEKKIKKINHESFKDYYNHSTNIAFVRTGETTPYANIILISGVTF